MERCRAGRYLAAEYREHADAALRASGGLVLPDMMIECRGISRGVSVSGRAFSRAPVYRAAALPSVSFVGGINSSQKGGG